MCSLTRPWGSSYDWVYRYVSLRDGEKCYLCNERADAQGRTLLIVEHRDNDPQNYNPANLGLAHRSCNGQKNPHGALPLYSVSVKVNPAPKVRSSDGFAPNKNREAEPVFRRWVYAIIKANRDYPKTRDWLVNNGAAFVGANPVTVDRYLDKMFAELFGMLCEDPTDKGEVVGFRDPSDYDLNVEELEAKYPWEGLVRSERYFPLRRSVDVVQSPPVSDAGGQD